MSVSLVRCKTQKSADKFVVSLPVPEVQRIFRMCEAGHNSQGSCNTAQPVTD